MIFKLPVLRLPTLLRARGFISIDWVRAKIVSCFISSDGSNFQK